MNYINLDSLMERVHRKLPPSDDINRSDVVEWVWEAINQIGVGQDISVPMYAYMAVTDFKSQLPSFIESIVGISYISDDPTLINRTDELQEFARYEMNEAFEPFFIDRSIDNVQRGYRYKVQGNYIYTTFEEGICEICFRSFPIDGQLEPMIPENVFMIDAVVWYVVYQALWRMSIRNANYTSIYTEAKREWQIAAGRARSTSMLFNNDGLLAIANKHHRIIASDTWRNKSSRYYYYPTIDRAILNTFVLCPNCD